MPYSRTLAPVLLCLVFMLTSADNLTCPPWLQQDGKEDLVKQIITHFIEILHRFDCPKPYSVVFGCHQCKEAYKAWVCAMFYTFQWKYKNILLKIKPCRSFCNRVEQRCPFFLPLDKNPAHYAGEPAFLCIDPNINESGEQLKNSAYGPNTCCYDACGTGLCIQGSCEKQEAVMDLAAESKTSTSSSQTLVATPLIVPLLLYRTRPLLI